jgi:tetratricopeptide (TPR) repeat protein
MGCAYEKLGKPRSAIHHYKRELEVNPLSGEACFNLGNLYYDIKRYKQASWFLEKCFALKHSVPEIVDRLAYSYFKTRQLHKEIKLYEDRLRVCPDNVWCLKNLGAALSEAGEHNRALIYLKKAARLDPKDRVVVRNMNRVQSIRQRSQPFTIGKNVEKPQARIGPTP